MSSTNPTPKKYPHQSNSTLSPSEHSQLLKQQYEADVAKKDELINDLRQIVTVLEKKLDRKTHENAREELMELKAIIEKQSDEIRLLKENAHNTSTSTDSDNKESQIERLQKMVDELAEQLLDYQIKYNELEEKYNSQILVRGRLRGHTHNTSIAKWESMFNDLTEKYDQLYKSYKMAVEERNTLKQKCKDIMTALSNSEKRLDREVRALETKLQQTMKEKLVIYDKQIDIESKYNILQSDYRQLKINMHFLEQKVKDDMKIREKTTSLLEDSAQKMPTYLGLYAKQDGEEDYDESTIGEPEKVIPFTRNQRLTSSRSQTTIDELEANIQNLIRSSSPTVKSVQRGGTSSSTKSSPSRTLSPASSPENKRTRTPSATGRARKPVSSSAKTPVRSSSTNRHSIASLPQKNNWVSSSSSKEASTKENSNPEQK